MAFDKERLLKKFRWTGDYRFTLTICDCHGVGVEGLAPNNFPEKWAEDIRGGRDFALRALRAALEETPTSAAHILIGSLLIVIARLGEMGVLQQPGDVRRCIFALLDVFYYTDEKIPDSYAQNLQDIEDVLKMLSRDGAAATHAGDKDPSGNLH